LFDNRQVVFYFNIHSFEFVIARPEAQEHDSMSDSAAIREQLDQFRADFQRLRAEIGKVIVGQDEIVEGTLTALIAGGHVLLEGVPGLGKTLLVRTLAEALHLKFQRIQFTPDLMPADLIGTNIVLETPEGARRFEFQRGPVFANILLADEINRATPKTQSALLEAMQEHNVTVAGQTFPLPEPFFVMATQNPLEMEGTYPLPEAQLDRFFFKLLVKYPRFAEIETILDRTTEAVKPRVEPIFDGQRILALSQLARQIPIAAEVRRYGIAIVMATHPENEAAAPMTRQYVRYGSSPRGAQAIILAAKLRAILDNRYHVARDDIRAVAPAALRHRLILNFEGQAENIHPDQVIANVIQNVKEPAMVA
jgi:MoxR-like ATPase